MEKSTIKNELIPEDIINVIFSFFPEKEIIKIRRTSKQWNQAAFNVLSESVLPEWQEFSEILESLITNTPLTQGIKKKLIDQHLLDYSLRNNLIELGNLLNTQAVSIRTSRKMTVDAAHLCTISATLLGGPIITVVGGITIENYLPGTILPILLVGLFVSGMLTILLGLSMVHPLGESVRSSIVDRLSRNVSPILIDFLTNFKNLQCKANLFLDKHEFMETAKILKSEMQHVINQKANHTGTFEFFQLQENPAKIVFDILIELNKKWGNEHLVKLFSSSPQIVNETTPLRRLN